MSFHHPKFHRHGRAFAPLPSLLHRYYHCYTQFFRGHDVFHASKIRCIHYHLKKSFDPCHCVCDIETLLHKLLLLNRHAGQSHALENDPNLPHRHYHQAACNLFYLLLSDSKLLVYQILIALILPLEEMGLLAIFQRVTFLVP